MAVARRKNSSIWTRAEDSALEIPEHSITASIAPIT
jgi:hypothetical protein